MAEFALALAVFSLAALSGWGILATASNTRENTMQNTLCASAMTPP